MKKQGKGGLKRSSAHNDRDTLMVELSNTLSADEDVLLAVAREAVDAYDAAMLAWDDRAAYEAANRYSAVVWKLNGGTFFGSHSVMNSQAAGHRVERHCRASPGVVPKWGQQGEFEITVSGVRSIVEIRDSIRYSPIWLAFHIIDADKPYISETGYKSHFLPLVAGQSVKEVAVAVFAKFLREGRCMLAREYREKVRAVKPPSWIRPARGDIEIAFEEPSGQIAFRF